MTKTKCDMGNATASWDGTLLRLSTGPVSRTYRLVPGGLLTESLTGPGCDQWIDAAGDCRTGDAQHDSLDRPDLLGPWLRSAADWYVLALTDATHPATLLGIEMEERPDDRWTSPHISVVARFSYPTHIELVYQVRLYPDSCGFWTQIGVRWTGDRDRHAAPSYLGGSWGESLALAFPAETQRLAAGYYNDTQHRNRDDSPLLYEERLSGHVAGREIYDRANLLRLTTDSAGLTLVKESHKCANQDGIDTGAFIVDPHGVRVTGVGISYADWATSGETVFGWPTWTVLHRPGGDDASLAVKQFDRCRYPVAPQRDLFVMANTWGSRGAGAPSRSAATEENLLTELDSCADLGIDVLQCDDGWQCAPGDPERPFDVGWLPNPERFPNGWRAVRKRAEQLGMKLGLWAPWFADFDALRRNVDEGGFSYLKLDFVNLANRRELDSLMARARDLIESSPGDLRVNWDVTENNPRVGYFVGREYGSVYLANRENGEAPLRRLVHIRYTPRLTLREAWHLARHLNLNQFQVTVQNKDLVVPDLSNCREYSHAYNAAIPLMALPIFFQETHFLSESARDQIRPVLEIWHQHVRTLQRGYVFPVGDEPSDYSWTGFQSFDPETQSGYLLLFREIYNGADVSRVALRFPSEKSLHVTPLLAGGPNGVRGLADEPGESLITPVDGSEAATVHLREPGSFVFARYERET